MVKTNKNGPEQINNQAKTTKNGQKPPKLIKNGQKLPKKLKKTHQQLSTITKRKGQKPPKAVKNHQRRSKTTQNPYIPLFLHS